MNAWVKIFTTLTVSLLSACSTQPTQQPSSAAGVETESHSSQETQSDNNDASNDPPFTVIKDGKTLNLVRIMDGGICKNELQGASGAFLVYADPKDIERIKREKPKEIFKDFESRIQNFSSKVLERAVDQTNLSIDPFSLGDDVMQEKLAMQLTKNFRNAVSRPLAAFIHETSLTIDVTPFSPSLIFYQKGCDVSRFNP